MQRTVELAAQQHFAHIGARRDLAHTHAGRRGKAGRPAMALVGIAFHEPFDVAGVDVELVLQDATRPDRPGLLIFRHADALAAQVRRRRDT